MRIWEKACERDRARTCWCFAVFPWDHMLRRPDAWHFKTFDLDDVPMAATKYYRCLVHSERYGEHYDSTFGAATSIV